MPQNPSQEERIYLPGLNGIRAIAALIVMIFHTDQWSSYFGLTPYGFWNTKMHTYAVVLFFVLSGFLITYLLLKEKEKYKKIDFKKFYIRRILRIWPVYYLALVVGIILLATMPGNIMRGVNNNFGLVAGLYSLLIPNIAFFLGYGPDLIGILWSVGVEEQFYAFWPFLVNKSRNLLKALIVFLLAYFAIKIAASLGYLSFIKLDIGSLLSFLPFDCMAIGAIAADFFYNKRKILQLIYNPLVQLISWAFLLVSIFRAPVRIPYLGGFNHEIHAFVYAIIILNVSTNPRTIISLENKVCDFLGRISYGIYAYHAIILFLVSMPLKNILPSFPSATGHAIMFIAEISATVLIAHLSYKYYESWFLRQKNKYLLIKSRNTRSLEVSSATAPITLVKE